MAMTKYFTLNAETRDLAPLALPVVIDGRQRLHPSPAQAAALGAYPRNDAYYPTDDPPEGKMWRRSTGWTVRDGKWCANFEAVDIPSPALDEYDAAMEDHLAQERSARGYTTREPTAYLASSNARWASDARDWVAHVDAVMAYALDLINAVQSGQRTPPTMAEFRAGLPQITWSFSEGA